MPELPEVETIKRQLAQKLIGLTIREIWSDVPKMIQGNPEEVFGSRVSDVRRRAKLLEIDTDNGRTLLIHLKMTGQLLYRGKGEGYRGEALPPLNTPSPNKSTHVIFHFDNGTTLFFNDLRKFGYVKILPTHDVEHTRILEEFGPEPLDPEFTGEDFLKRLATRKSMKIKQLLLDQKFLAGVGNIYANEALFRAKIDPRTRVGDLTRAQIQELFTQIREVLEIGVQSGGASDRTYVNAFGQQGGFMDYAQVYARTDQACPVCGTRIQRIALGGRGTFFCPQCQRESTKS